jgi:hypothetical protein
VDCLFATRLKACFAFVKSALSRHIAKVRKLEFAFPYPLLLLAIWTGVLLAGNYVVLDTSARQIRAVGFATTLGEIIKSEMGHGSFSRRGVEIGYSYTVNGMDYTGRRYRYDDRNGAFDYSAVTNALSRGSKQTVYYDPANPVDSVLVPGLAGCDLLLALFAIPLTVVTSAMWIAVVRSRRDGGGLKPAGGVRIFQREGETRVRLAEFSAAGAGFFVLAAAAFAAAILVVLAAGFKPSLGLMSAILILVAAAGLAAFLWTAQRHYFGRCDLRSHDASQTLLVPPACGRKELLLVPRGEIVSVSMHRRVSNSPSGEYFSYVPAVDHAAPGAETQSLDLVSWGWKEGKARAFAGWLSHELGVPLKGVEKAQAAS